MKPRLNKAEREEVERTCYAYVTPLFVEWVVQIKTERELPYGNLDPRDRDLWLNSFGDWLSEYRPEIASNE